MNARTDFPMLANLARYPKSWVFADEVGKALDEIDRLHRIIKIAAQEATARILADLEAESS